MIFFSFGGLNKSKLDFVLIFLVLFKLSIDRFQIVSGLPQGQVIQKKLKNEKSQK